MSEQRKAVIKNADMSEEMQQDAVDIASQALAKYNIEKVSRHPDGRAPLIHCRSTKGDDADIVGLDLPTCFCSNEVG